MKQTGKIFLWSALLICISTFTSQAQPSFIFPSLTVDQGSEFNVDLKVASFEDILAVQFTMEWDVSVLKFVAVESFGITDLNLSNFGVEEINTSNGKLTIAWSPDNPVVGVTVLDSTTIFSIVFEAVGEPGASTSIQFTDTPTVREIANVELEVFENVEYVEGMINILGPNNTITVSGNADAISVVPSFPNPFSNQTQFQFELKELTQTQVRIISASGQSVFEENRLFSAGTHSLVLKKDIFPSVGAYYLQLIASDFLVNQKLIFKNL